MKSLYCWLVAAAGLAVVTVPCRSQVLHRWEFSRNGDFQNWSVPKDARGVVMGGALWVTLAPREKDPSILAGTRYQLYGDSYFFKDTETNFYIKSPDSLDIPPPANGQLQVRLRILNLSPVTDLFLAWRPKGQDWGVHDPLGIPANSKRCALKSDLKEWQVITCYVDKNWHDAIDQVAIVLRQPIRGDIWFNSVELAEGAREPQVPIPDLASAHVVPKISLPGISQSGFVAAFRAMADSLITDVPVNGFTYPITSPGGYYVPSWWEDDASLTVDGAKWTNPTYAENAMRGFRDAQSQNPDGHIDLYGWEAVRGQVSDVSNFPQFLHTAYDIARRTDDTSLRVEIYHTLTRYLDWWLSPIKRDQRTGLISGVFEETFGEVDIRPDTPGNAPQSVAPVDLNVAVAVGTNTTAELAHALGYVEDEAKYRKSFQELTQAINQYLWDEKDGVYYNYDLLGQHSRRRLLVTTFDPLRLGIASPARRARLLRRLLNPAEFNWGKLPLTSMAMTSPEFVEATGQYDGRAWFGDVWTNRNLTVIQGLEESGQAKLAADLGWATIKEFHANYWEFLVPSTGKGQGADKYAWTAAQYVQAIVEHLFGVDFDQMRRTLTIAPRIPHELYRKSIALDGLLLPGCDCRLSIRVKQTSPTVATISLAVVGTLPDVDFLITLPGTAQAMRVPAQSSFTARLRAGKHSGNFP